MGGGRERGRQGGREEGREGGRNNLMLEVLFSLYLNGCSLIGKVNYILSSNMQH